MDGWIDGRRDGLDVGMKQFNDKGELSQRGPHKVIYIISWYNV